LKPALLKRAGGRGSIKAIMRIISLVSLLSIAACAPQAPSDTGGNATDPAITQALSDPLLTDVRLDNPPLMQQPATALIPVDARIDTAGAPTLGAVAITRLHDAAFARCSPQISYSARWSLSLPARLALPDGARLSEAAGNDQPGCALRLMRFAMPGTPAMAIDRYAALAQQNGFTMARADGTISAAHPADGTVFHVDAVASADGTRIDLTVRTR
jgi:hypothetical protein